MSACPGHNTTQACPQRHTCELYRKYLEADGGLPVSIFSMPVSASDGCYMYQPASAGIREAVRISEVTRSDSM